MILVPLLSFFYSHRNQGIERLSNMLKVINDGNKIQTQAVWLRVIQSTFEKGEHDNMMTFLWDKKS